MNKLVIITKKYLIFISLVLFYLQPQHAYACQDEIATIEKMINSIGQHGSVQTLFCNNSMWDSLLKKISTGEKDCIKIALLLKRGSDAAPSEMLSFAVGEALDNNPEIVLEIAIGIFEIYDICGGVDVDDIRYKTFIEAELAIKKRIESVQLVAKEDLIQSRDLCISRLRDSILHMKGFYIK
jgi:hypothetical protein